MPDVPNNHVRHESYGFRPIDDRLAPALATV